MRMTKKVALSIFLFVLISINVVVSSLRCFGTGFEPDSLYKSNIQNILSYLVTNVTNSRGFYNTSAGQDFDTVYAMGMCTTRSEPRVCSDCMEAATSELKSCPNQTEAYTWRSTHDALCFARYSNRSFFGKFVVGIDLHPLYMEYNSESINANLTLEDFEEKKWTPFTDNMVSEASKEKGKQFSSAKYLDARKEVLTKFQTLYAIMQCTPDLSAEQCRDCLEESVKKYQNSITRGRQGGIIAWPQCFFRWDVQPFSGAFDPDQPSSGDFDPRVRCSKRISTTVFIAAVVPLVVISSILVVLVLRRREPNPNEMPEVPTIESEEYEKLDLPDVPMKTPVAADAKVTPSESASKRKVLEEPLPARARRH